MAPEAVALYIRATIPFSSYALTVLIFFSTLSYAQKLEGRIQYFKTENVEKKMAVLDYMSKQSIDNFTYAYAKIYGNGNESTSYSTLYLNANQSKYEELDENGEGY